MLNKPVVNITPFTLLDYPHHSACILWYAGCNMRCLYCYNPEIVLGKGTMEFSSVLSFLKTRVGLLDAVVFSGGECTIHKGISEQIEQVKALGFTVKIDTNGSRPALLHQLIKKGLIDYVALDFKSSPNKFRGITKSNLFEPFLETLKIITNSNMAFEVRTTYHSDLLDKNDIKEMIDLLEANDYHGNYYIQYFRNGSETIEKLNWSSKNLISDSLSTKRIKVVFR
jgi:pyruvate formate lyase activating enzyme